MKSRPNDQFGFNPFGINLLSTLASGAGAAKLEFRDNCRCIFYQSSAVFGLQKRSFRLGESFANIAGKAVSHFIDVGL